MTETTEPNAAKTAADEMAKRAGEKDSPPARRGRPPGSKTKKGSSRKSAAKPPDEDPITDQEIASYAFLGNTVWSISARIFKMELLTDEEQLQLGTAMAPVVRKYLPMLGDYGPETVLITVVAGLVITHQKKKPVEGEPDLELIDGKDGEPE